MVNRCLGSLGRLVIAASLGIVLSAHPAAGSTIVLDQNQPVDTITMALFWQADLAQSFQQTFNNIAGAGIFLEAGFGTTDTVTIQLWDALPNASGNLLASGNAIGTPGSWLDVFWSPVSIAPSTTYYLVFTATNTTFGEALAIGGSTANPYPAGQTYANAGFQAYPSYDYAFRTYADADFAPVPEPASLTLLGLGLAGMAGRRWRQRKAS